MKNDRVMDYDGNKVYLKSGKEIIASNNVIWAAGVTGNVISWTSIKKALARQQI